MMLSMANYDDEFEANGEFDTIAASIPAVYLDSRNYYWPMFQLIFITKNTSLSTPFL